MYTGQQIGQVGETGRASGCHLHFEVWGAPGWYSGGRPVDPTAAAEGLGRLLLSPSALVPLAHVADLQRSIDFYETLGFAVEERYEQEGWLLWCRLRRDRAELMLALASEPVTIMRRACCSTSLWTTWTPCARPGPDAARSLEHDAPRPGARDAPAGSRRLRADGGRAGVSSLKAFEAEGWNEQASSYDLLTGRVTARVAAPLLNAADVMAGHRVLDVACGTGGAVGRRHAPRRVAAGHRPGRGDGGRGPRRLPGVEFRVADAESLPFPDDRFDAAVGGFVLNHLPHPARCAEECARVVAPGGRVAFAVWERPERSRLIACWARRWSARAATAAPACPTAPTTSATPTAAGCGGCWRAPGSRGGRHDAWSWRCRSATPTSCGAA